MNHAADGCLHRLSADGGLVVVAQRAYAAGEQVSLCYGAKSPAELLAGYGVLPPTFMSIDNSV